MPNLYATGNTPIGTSNATSPEVRVLQPTTGALVASFSGLTDPLTDPSINPITIGGIAQIGQQVIVSALQTIIPPPEIEVSPITGRVGLTGVSLFGSGFVPGDTISVTFEGSPLTLVGSPILVANDSTWGAGFTVPNSAQVGIQTITAIDQHGRTASTTFTVLPPTLSVLPAWANIGDTPITLVGAGYAPGDNITVTFDGFPLTVSPSPPLVASDGSWTATFTVPSSPWGYQGITATDAHLHAASTLLQVGQPAFVWMKAFYNSMYGVALLPTDELQLYQVIPQGTGYTWEYVGSPIPYGVSTLGSGGNPAQPFAVSATDIVVTEQTAGAYTGINTTWCLRVIHLSGTTISLSGAQHSVNTLGSLFIGVFRCNEGQFLFAYPGYQDDYVTFGQSRYAVYDGMSVSGGTVSQLSHSAIGPAGGSHTTITTLSGILGSNFAFVSGAYGGVVISESSFDTYLLSADWTVSGGVSALYKSLIPSPSQSPQILGIKDGLSEGFTFDFGGDFNVYAFVVAPGGSISWSGTLSGSTVFPVGLPFGPGEFGFDNGAFVDSLVGYDYIGWFDNGFDLQYELTAQSGTSLTPSGNDVDVTPANPAGFSHANVGTVHAGNIVAGQAYTQDLIIGFNFFYYPFAFKAQ